jgi:hypothetical protein
MVRPYRGCSRPPGAERDGIGGADVPLADLDNFVALIDSGGHSLQWLQGNTVLVANTFFEAISYQLARASRSSMNSVGCIAKLPWRPCWVAAASANHSNR